MTEKIDPLPVFNFPAQSLPLLSFISLYHYIVIELFMSYSSHVSDTYALHCPEPFCSSLPFALKVLTDLVLFPFPPLHVLVRCCTRQM